MQIEIISVSGLDCTHQGDTNSGGFSLELSVAAQKLSTGVHYCKNIPLSAVIVDVEQLLLRRA